MTGGLHWAPLLPQGLLLATSVFVVGLLVYAWMWGGGRFDGLMLRLVATGLVVLALMNPTLIEEARESRDDIALVIVDESESQRIGDREADARNALAHLQDRAGLDESLSLRVVSVGDAEDDIGGPGGTRLFEVIERELSTIPVDRLAGIVLITDGQVHDVPTNAEAWAATHDVPLHALLTGKRDERDRRMVIEKAPGYGIVGETVRINYRVEDAGTPQGMAQGTGGFVEVVLRVDGEVTKRERVPIGKSGSFSVPLTHAGATMAELEVQPAPGELSPANNRAVVAVNGVRDRLRVLLVSGQPHNGERTWRNLLKSDPAVDLVHFTILRPPEKDDLTPLSELSLIVFPVRKLFDESLHEFDLIVFDRYVVRDVLPPNYHRNMAEYVAKGGAILLAHGPEFAGIRSLYHTPLGSVMPARPLGQVIETRFKPQVNELGLRHPVTAGLTSGAVPEWGDWFRLVDVAQIRDGEVLMTGPGDRPLLMLGRVGEGRVAQLMSDHLWLWARGFDGGGPQAELLRRTAHWLMKEPELEEETLTARIKGDTLRIERRSLGEAAVPVTLVRPDGASQALTLKATEPGRASAEVKVLDSGLYRVEDGAFRALAAKGRLNAPELMDLRASADPLAATVAASGGGMSWIGEGLVDFRRTEPDRDQAGRGWLGLRRNGASVVTGVSERPLLPPVLVLVLGFGLFAVTWWREGR